MTDETQEDFDARMSEDIGDFQLNVKDETHFVKVKCTPCNAQTVHEWKMVELLDAGETDLSALEIISMSRRLILCTTCGNLSLKK